MKYQRRICIVFRGAIYVKTITTLMLNFMELTLGINVIENISETAHFDLVQRFFFLFGPKL